MAQPFYNKPLENILPKNTIIRSKILIMNTKIPLRTLTLKGKILNRNSNKP